MTFNKTTAVAIAIATASLVILALGYFGFISPQSPVEKTAEELFKAETGIEVELPTKK